MVENVDTFSEFEKRRILSVLGENKDLMEIAAAKIFTSSKEGSSWLYSDLEGFLCYLIDHQEKVQLIVLYDFNTYEKLFQFELYCDFQKYYFPLSADFHCFETNNGFVGLKFQNQQEAKTFNYRILKVDSMNQLFKKSLNRRRDKYKKGKENVLLLKENFLKNESNYEDIDDLDNKIFEDGMEINKPSYYQLLNSISYDKDKRVFRIDDLSPDLKILFKLSGLKKSDFKYEFQALNILKHLALCWDALQMKKKDKRKLLRNDHNKDHFKSFFEDDIHAIDHIVKKRLSLFDQDNSRENIKFRTMKSGFIPQVPKLPSLPIFDLKNKTDEKIENIGNNIETRSVTIVSNKINSDINNIILKPINSYLNNSAEKSETKTDSFSTSSEGPRNSFLEEITKGVQLKKINQAPNEEDKRPLKINKDDRGFLQSALQKAIQQRRDELTKNDVSEEDSGSDSDWSD